MKLIKQFLVTIPIQVAVFSAKSRVWETSWLGQMLQKELMYKEFILKPNLPTKAYMSRGRIT